MLIAGPEQIAWGQFLFRHKSCQLNFQVRLNGHKEKTHATSKAICMNQTFSSIWHRKNKKRFINIKLISTHILYNSFSQKASPKISSEDQQNAILILPTEKSGENNRSSEIPGICNKIPCSQSTGCVVSTSRHHTFKLKVSLMKKTPIQSKSGNVQTKVLYSGGDGKSIS